MTPARPAATSRRGVLLGLGAVLLAAAAPATRPIEVAPGLFVLPGLDEDASAANLDALANTGFVIGRDAVAVIDPGGSLAHGRLLRQAIEAVTPLPIRHLVLTHVHPDHAMGAAAFADCGAEVVTHSRLPAALAQRGEFYRRMLEREMGEAAAGSAVLAPTRLVQDRLDLDLGGRVLALQAHPPAHTDHDLSLLDGTTGTLWTGDLLFVRRIPSLDGSLSGWMLELEALRAKEALRAVPGHGPPAVPWPAGAADLTRYLLALRDGTRAAIAAGIGIAEAPARVAPEEAARWRLGEAYHGRNVTAAYRELEWE
ncbi:quinoprotein relay system zinc metallohydrolase 2 [Dankookia rubra]|uniref:quinoprotein relay system zinc metallohydrolase 2 n=1 Tax=Dankookia rubra TaxID=1442381 RepID=UPI001F503643|nr:quinoprotein relay system zinc metallohydrolase 2 [Dankookia rubra]